MSRYSHVKSGKPALLVSGLEEESTRKWVLCGNLVTMTGTVIYNGALCIDGPNIKHVLPDISRLSEYFPKAKIVNVEGWVFPGLIDLHNHPAYNCFPLWNPKKKFGDRSEWRSSDEYKNAIQAPAKELGKKLPMEIVRYVEAKALLAGTTTFQGLSATGKALYTGLVRNVELPDSPGLSYSLGFINDVTETTVDVIKQFIGQTPAFYYHLCEGVLESSRHPFELLDRNNALQGSLIGIHSLALKQNDFAALQAVGAKVVWSPTSNFMLYGTTVDPAMLLNSKVQFSIGSDWNPSSGKNLLFELKVAKELAKGTSLDSEKLCRAVTIEAAKVAKWDNLLGSLEAGKLADILVVDAKSEAPYEDLVLSTEMDVQGVIIDGVPRYGSTEFLENAGQDSQDVEFLTINGKERGFVFPKNGPLSKVSLGQARERLEQALANLQTLETMKPAEHEGASFSLDFEIEAEGDTILDLTVLPSIQLDPMTVAGDQQFFSTLKAIDHLPEWFTNIQGYYSNDLSLL